MTGRIATFLLVICPVYHCQPSPVPLIYTHSGVPVPGLHPSHPRLCLRYLFPAHGAASFSRPCTLPLSSESQSLAQFLHETCMLWQSQFHQLPWTNFLGIDIDVNIHTSVKYTLQSYSLLLLKSLPLCSWKFWNILMKKHEKTLYIMYYIYLIYIHALSEN